MPAGEADGVVSFLQMMRPVVEAWAVGCEKPYAEVFSSRGELIGHIVPEFPEHWYWIGPKRRGIERLEVWREVERPRFKILMPPPGIQVYLKGPFEAEIHQSNS